ncbi:MAG TPA: dihydroorotate dehydrogenase [Desulfotomaculum sp.]|nr:dihydroorotate dehydrogenase [Peptococcaceae bacterium SCADC1_2_3]HBQ28054.1 dihydroorotate dehydrogenase [Desulfotomaculum sp.]
MVAVDLTVEIAGLKLKNPVITASGTFGFGQEYAPYVDLSRLGAITVKGLTLLPRPGNPPPRLVETPAGILNAIGLQNPGVEYFAASILPYLSQFKIPVIVNMAGETVEEYAALAAKLSELNNIAALEVNISCPNVKKGGLQFGSDPTAAAEVTRAVKNNTCLPVIVKLSPNVTRIEIIAQAVAQAGADALSLINTVLGMAIDLKERRPILGNIFGGLSGPAIKPVAIRAVWQVFEEVSLPIIGMGGIFTAQDALEFIMAGAKAIAVGTANFINPRATIDILEGIENYLRENKIEKLSDLVGVAHYKT